MSWIKYVFAGETLLFQKIYKVTFLNSCVLNPGQEGDLFEMECVECGKIHGFKMEKIPGISFQINCHICGVEEYDTNYLDSLE